MFDFFDGVTRRPAHGLGRSAKKMTRFKIGIMITLLCSGIVGVWAIWCIHPSFSVSRAVKDGQIGNEAASHESLSRADVQEALITLAEAQGLPLDLSIPDLRAGRRIRYLPDNEEGVSPGTWNVDLSKRTFLWFLGGDRIYLEIRGVFQKDGAKWKAVITGTTRS